MLSPQCQVSLTRDSPQRPDCTQKHPAMLSAIVTQTGTFIGPVWMDWCSHKQHLQRIKRESKTTTVHIQHDTTCYMCPDMLYVHHHATYCFFLFVFFTSASPTMYSQPIYSSNYLFVCLFVCLNNYAFPNKFSMQLVH